jgi:L-malate glycosyltransferase
VLRYFRDRSRAVRLMIAYWVAMRCDRYTAVSEDAANHFRRYLRPGAKIEVIPNFLSDNIFEVGHTKAHSDRPFTFATILQGWTRRKNATAALKAFAIASRSAPESRLIMMGTDYEEDGPAHRWARHNGCDRGVTFAGCLPYKQMLRRVSDEVDVIVHPSLDEAFSMTVLESMALGKTVIAGRDTPGIRQALRDGDAGVLTDVRDSGSIAQAMLALLANPSNRQRLAQNGYEHVASTYRKEIIIPQYEAVYRSLPCR